MLHVDFVFALVVNWKYSCVFLGSVFDYFALLMALHLVLGFNVGGDCLISFCFMLVDVIYFG